MQDSLPQENCSRSEAIQSLYLRGAFQLSYQVRSCDDPLCDTEVFEGPAGSESAYSELTAHGTGPAAFALSVPDNRYFQYVVSLDSLADTRSPVLVDVAVTGAPP